MDKQRVGDYILLCSLGAGATGKVKLAKHKDTGHEVAIKVIKKSEFDRRPGLEKKVRREIALMSLCDHPRLLKLIEVCESRNHMYMILEHAKKGELFDLMTTMKVIPVVLGMKMFRQIIYGLEYLHARAICHRDIKPENLLLDEFDDIKIGDFGFARWMREDVADTSCGSPHYAAPEVIRGIQYDGRKADIWSCGVILFAMLSGKLPFSDTGIRHLLAKVKSGRFTMPDLPTEIQSLIAGMLVVDVNARLTVAQIKEHPAFRAGIPVMRDFVLPTPLPLPSLTKPVDMASVDETVLSTLREIGFASDEELKDEFAKVGHSMAKVFCAMLKAQGDLDELHRMSWHGIGGEDVDDVDTFLVSPETMTYASEPHLPTQTMTGALLSPQNGSLAEHARWAEGSKRNYESDTKHEISGINMTMDLLMNKVQVTLTSAGFQWFYPDEISIMSRHADEPTYLILKVRNEPSETLHLDMFFWHTNHLFVQATIEAVRAALEEDVEAD